MWWSMHRWIASVVGCGNEPLNEFGAKAEVYLARQICFDPDLWIIETEDRAGRHFLDRVVH